VKAAERGARPLRAAVVGAGAFGRNHLRVYRELELAGVAVELAAVVDRDPDALAAAAQYGVPGFQTIEDCLQTLGAGGLDAASVSVPTVRHAECAATLLAAGVDLLIEKPLAATLAEADEIVRLARRLGRVVQVGHLERFNPAVRAARGLLNRPMFFEVHRLSVFTLRSLDVDVVLDLMIHDLDIVMNFVGSPVREVRAVGLPVLSPKVDIANVRLEFENGCIANFTASRVSTERVRKMRFFQPHQYLSLDFARQDLLTIDVSGATARAGLSQDALSQDALSQDALSQAQLAAIASAAGGLKASEGDHPSAGLSLRKVAVQAGEPLRLEIAAFLKAVGTRSEPVVTVEDGRAALGLALEINAAIRSHARRTGL
jgi:predicted dehydrogenase